MSPMIASLGLGTVQFGLEYGISNEAGKVNAEAVKNLLNRTAELEIKILDTAYLYGDSEQVLGGQNLALFNVVTKTPHFNVSQITDEHASSLKSSFYTSLTRLNVHGVYGLLIHNANDLLMPGGEKLFKAMQELKVKGLITKIGVSIYDSQQVELILNRFDIDLVQIPMNVLDQRLVIGGQMSKLKEKNIEVHVRSVFLQGLLLMALDDLPQYFQPIVPLLKGWHAAAKEQGFTLLEAALCYIRDLTGVDVVLVGVENAQQLNDCAEAFAKNKSFDATDLNCDDPQFVNPALWQNI